MTLKIIPFRFFRLPFALLLSAGSFAAPKPNAVFIEKNRNRAFFLNDWAFSVHAPFDGKKALIEKYARKANGGNTYSRVNDIPPTSNSPLRGGKAMIYEGGTCVPWKNRAPRPASQPELQSRFELSNIHA